MSIQSNAVAVLLAAQMTAADVSISHRSTGHPDDGLTAIPTKARNNDPSLDPKVSIIGREPDVALTASGSG